MAMDFEFVGYIFLIQFLGFVIKGVIGFGDPLFSGPLLSMRLDNVIITPGCLLLSCPVNAWIAWQNRKSFHWKKLLPLIVANLCGVVPGALLLRSAMPWILKAVLGALVIGLGVDMAFSGRNSKAAQQERLWPRLLISACSGVCAGLFGINLLVVAYLQRVAEDYAEFKGGMCFFFLGENLFRVILYTAMRDVFTKEVFLFAVVSLPAVVLAMALSKSLISRWPEKQFRTAATAIFILSGVSIILKALIFQS